MYCNYEDGIWADGYRKLSKKTFGLDEIRLMFGTSGNLEKEELERIQA